MFAYIDHVTIAVRDLDVARETFRRRFSFVVGAKQSGEGPLANAVVPLLQGYVELLSPAGERPQARSPTLAELTTFLEAQEGLYSFALRSSSIETDVAALRERGSTLEIPNRQTAPGSGEEIAWWTSFPVVDSGVVEPYIIQSQGFDESLGRQAALSQPLSIRSIEEVTIIVPKVEAALEVYERDFGVKPSRQLAGRAQLAVGGGRIMVVPSSMAPLGTPLGIYSVSLGTTDINGARNQLRGRGIELRDDPFSWGVSFQIDPSEAFGARINLVQL